MGTEVSHDFEYFKKEKKRNTKAAKILKGHEFENPEEDVFGPKRFICIEVPLHQENGRDSLLNFSIGSL